MATALCLGTAGCGQSESDAGSGGAAGAGTGGAGGTANCVQTDSSSTIPGVSINFASQPCTFTLAQAAAGIAIDYEVTVDQEIASFSPSPQDMGQCGTPDSSGLIVFERLSGNGQSYCLCDQGPCVGVTTKTTVKAASYPAKFVWDGLNWTGPSDTNNPKGAPFPAGSYILEVSTRGSLDASTGLVTASAQFPITLVP